MCELECFKGNMPAILFLCNLKKLRITNGKYETNTPKICLIYLTKATQIELDCPLGKIRDNLIRSNLIQF